MGEDRVFDVIESDIFLDVNLEDVIHSTFDGDATNYDTVIEHELTQENVEKKIKEQRDQIGHSNVQITVSSKRTKRKF